MIKNDNPEMTDEQIAFSIAAMKKYGIVDFGDALTMGIGAMTDARWESFFTKSMVWGVYPADLPYQTGYTTQVRQPGPRPRAEEEAHRRVMAAGDPDGGCTGRPRRRSSRCTACDKVFANGTQALAGLDLAIGRHEFVSLLGPVGLRQEHGRCG